MEFELHSSSVFIACSRIKQKKGARVMTLPKSFTKQVYIRLEGGEAFVSTVKYGCFYSKTNEFKVCSEAPELSLQEDAQLAPKYLVPPLTAQPWNQGE